MMLRTHRKTRNPREESTVTRTQERITGYGCSATLFPHHVKNRSSLRVVVKRRWMGLLNGMTIVSCFKQETSALMCQTNIHIKKKKKHLPMMNVFVASILRPGFNKDLISQL